MNRRHYILDTDTCIYLIKGRSPQASQKASGEKAKNAIAHEKLLSRLQNERPGDIAISSITWTELQYGVAKSHFKEQNARALESFILPIDILPFDEVAAQRSGELRAVLESVGKTVGGYDLLIAGHALSTGSILVTNNESEFRRVPKLRLENWAK